jgi:hypothetical protein
MADYSNFTAGSCDAHVSVDRIVLQGYVPKLQSVGVVCQFLHWQKGFGIPSSAAFGKIGDAYVAVVYRWVKVNGIPVRRFGKGENKEEIARPLIEAAEREGWRRAGGVDRHRAGKEPDMAVINSSQCEMISAAPSADTGTRATDQPNTQIARLKANSKRVINNGGTR